MKWHTKEMTESNTNDEQPKKKCVYASRTCFFHTSWHHQSNIHSIEISICKWNAKRIRANMYSFIYRFFFLWDFNLIGKVYIEWMNCIVKKMFMYLWIGTDGMTNGYVCVWQSECVWRRQIKNIQAIWWR